MLLDDQEQNDLMERGQKFLKTKRVKKLAAKPHFTSSNVDTSHYQPMTDEATHKDEVTQIDTSSKKKEATPMKTSVKKEEQQQLKKPGRKPVEKPPKPVQNIFSTVKANPA